jgi:hypothetical protein
MSEHDRSKTLPPRSYAEILGEATARINESLAPSLKAIARVESFSKAMQPSIAAILNFSVMSKEIEKFAIDVKSQVNVRDLLPMIESLKEASKQLTKLSGGMVMARYLSKSAQDILKLNGISYADATGNFMITSPSTGTFVMSDAGAKSDPWRTRGRPSDSLKGNAPAKVIRTLLDEELPMTMTELIRLSASSSSVAYRVVEYLEEEGLLAREAKAITFVDFKKLSQRWSEEYSFYGNNSVIGFLSPRGIEDTLKRLQKVRGFEYAITGSVAAARYAPYAEAKQLNLYTRFPLDLAKELDLRPVESGANVMIAATAYDVVYRGSIIDGGLIYVAPSQIAVDLLNSKKTYKLSSQTSSGER